MTWIHHGDESLDKISTHPTVIAVTLTFATLMLVTVITRGIYRRNVFGWDDGIIFITALFSIVYTILAIVQTRYGLALPIPLRPEETVRTQKLLSYAGKPWYTFALAGYKVALCIGYLRFIDGATMPRYRAAIFAVAATSVVMQTIFTLVNFLSCIPVPLLWDDSLDGTCLPWYPVQYSMAAFQIASDVSVWILPIPLFLKLSINQRVALGLSILFACGLTTSVAAIVRATYLKEVGPNGKGSNTLVVVLGCVEVDVGIMMACLPFLRGLIKGVFHVPRRAGRHHDDTTAQPDWPTWQTPTSGGGHTRAKPFVSHSEKEYDPSQSSSDEGIFQPEKEEEEAIAEPEPVILKTTQVVIHQEQV